MRNSMGFTLIELVVVLVILGILAAVAVPRFVDLSGQAETAAMEGVVGSVESASAINFAACSADSASADCISISAGDDCSAFITTGASGIMQQFPSDYSPTGTAADNNDGTANCTIDPPSNQNVASGTATILLTSP